MSQDIRSFFKKTPSKGTPGSKEPDSSKKKKRFIVDSDSDDDLQLPQSKKNKSSTDKSSRTTPKSKKKNSPKKEAASPYSKVNKMALDSIFGKNPVKRGEVVKKGDKNVKNAFEDDESLIAAAMQMDGVFHNEWINEKSSPSSGFCSASPISTISLSENSPSKSPKQNYSLASRSPVKTTPTKDDRVSNEIGPCLNVLKEKFSEKYEAESKDPTEVSSLPKRKLINDDTSVTASKRSILGSNNSSQSQKEENKNTKFSPLKSESPLISGLWVDKYKPLNTKQIIGQQGDKSNVNKLLKWLRDWHINHSGHKKLTKPSPWAKDDSGAYFKAALLSGPPGVGKTTTAHLVCKELEMDVVEFNASDTRSKKLLNQEVGELLSSKSLSPFFTGSGGEVTKRHVLVMDEVDGMAGNEDRGGVQELIQLIKNSKIPVICMCNDRNHVKIRSLANYCFDLRFNKPNANQIKGAMLSICFKEKLKIKPEVLMDIIVNTNQDIRLILNHLSLLSASNEKNLKASTKDIKIGPWDVLRKVFSESDHKSMSIHDKSDLFFHDYSIAPLFVQENYIMVVPHSLESKSKLGKMNLFAKAAESIANGDLIDRAIRSKNAWSLLPAQAMFSSLIPGDLLEGHMGGQINFPLWLGKNSKRNKMDRLVQEIQCHTRLRISGSKEDVGLDYVKPLLEAIVRPLAQEGSEGTEDSLNVMREYSLLREDIESLTQLNDWNLGVDIFSKLDSKLKSAFTRAYNKNPVMSPFTQVSAIKKKGRKGDNLDYENDDEESDSSEPEDDDVSKDAMIVVKKKTEKKTTVKSETGSSRTSKRGGGGGTRGKRGKN